MLQILLCKQLLPNLDRHQQSLSQCTWICILKTVKFVVKIGSVCRLNNIVLAETVPICLICSKTVKRCSGQFNSSRKTPNISNSCKKKLPYQQEKSAEAALRVYWMLNKHQRPFSDPEIVKDRMLEATAELFEEKRHVVTASKCIWLLKIKVACSNFSSRVPTAEVTLLLHNT